MPEANNIREEFENIPVAEAPPQTKKDSKTELLQKTIKLIKEQYGLDLEPRNNIQYKTDQVKAYLINNYTFRFNTVMNAVEYQDKDSDSFQFFSDRDFKNIQNELKFHNYNVGKDALKSLIESKFISQIYDPFREFIFSLKQYDGQKDYIKEYLSQIKLSDESERELFITTFKKWLVAMVGSMIDDRVTNQHCFVLVGQQGRFKTTFLNNIVPKEMQLDYLYSSKFNFESKDHFVYLATKMLINLDELATFNRTDIGVLKTILTDDRVIARRPYDAYDTKMWRRASFCGSTNNDEFLTDETGSRRFLIFKTDNIAFDKAFDVRLIYEQAFYYYKNDFQYWFDLNDIDVITNRNNSFQDVSIEQDLIMGYIAKPTNDEVARQSLDSRVVYENATSINVYLAGKSNRINVNESTKRRVGQVLRKLGFRQVSKYVQDKKESCKLWEIKYLENGPKYFDENNVPVNDDVI
jgi:predicted P-loop ATPase